MLIDRDNPTSLLTESYRGLRTSLEYISVDKELKVIVVTSSSPGEGKSTISSNLAFILSQMEKKVLIIDADLRKSKIHRIFKIHNDSGLTDILIGKKRIKESIQKVDENLDAITSGEKTPNPAEMLSSKAMEELLDILRKKYDYIIIDTPPIRNINDGVVLAAKADGAILVVRSGQTKEQDIIKGYRELEKVKANVLGTVLNAAEKKKDKYYYYYYE